MVWRYYLMPGIRAQFEKKVAASFAATVLPRLWEILI